MRLIKPKYNSLKDEELMAEVIKGNQAAFSELYDKWSKPILNYFYKMLWQDLEKSQDFMQDLFTKIIHKPQLFNVNKSFKTWIYTIAYNMCKNEYRKNETRKNINNNLNENIVKLDQGNHDKTYDNNIFNERLNQELELLSNNHKKVFIMRMKHNLSIKEIAEIMETSEGTVKSRIFYTLKKLSVSLKEFNPVNTLAYILLINEILITI
jgi:RNA polymerase sigma-70 factor (ECF subfamily)